MAADRGRRQRTARDDSRQRIGQPTLRYRKTSCQRSDAIGADTGGPLFSMTNYFITLTLVAAFLMSFPLGAVAKNPFGPALKALNHTIDVHKMRNVTWERYLLLLSTPQVPERYVPDLPQAKWGDSVRKYSVRNCGSRYDPVRYDELRLRPDPLSFPGSVFVTSAIKVSRDITAPIKVEISMKKKVYLWVTVPCVNDFGSCDYDDICSVKDCPLFYEFLGLPCGCPIKEGEYSVQNKEFEVPALMLPDWITSGDYQVIVKARSRGDQLFCVHFTLSLK
ncbi:ganglioside GM2 activator-like isoform X2 [Amblyomma americanum]